MWSARALRLWGAIFLFAIAGAAGVWGFWLYKTSVAEKQLLTALRESVQLLLRLEVGIWQQEMRLRTAFFEKVAGSALPATLLRQPELRGTLKSLEVHVRTFSTQPEPALRALVEQVLLLEQRHAGWRRALERSERKEDYLPVIEQYYVEGPALLSSVENELRRFREVLRQRQLELEGNLQKEQQTAYQIGVISLWAAGVIGILALLLIGRKEERSFQAMLKAASQGERLSEAPSPWLPLVQRYNQLLQQLHLLSAAIESLAERQSPNLEELRGAFPSIAPLERIVQRMSQQEGALLQLAEEKRQLLEQIAASEALFREQVARLQLELGAFQNLLPIAQLDMNGYFLSKNDLFLQLGFSPTIQSVAELSPDFAQLLQRRTAAQGFVSVNQGTYAYAILPYREGREEKALLALIEVSALQRQVQEAENALNSLHRRLHETEEVLNRLQQQYAALQTEYNHEKERLLRQRQSLQTLLKLPALQKGEVLEGLAAICEVAAAFEPEARYSFWVFGSEEESGLHCLEAYDPVLLSHSNTIDLPPEAAQWVREQLHEPVSPGPHQPETPALQMYMSRRQVQRLWMFPLYLDEEVAGAFFVERLSIEPPRDPEYLALLARIASLLLQQGHRKLVEQELIGYLEQAQALEEELRQNIEELEASAEEMRRTQAELRGQITALNAAALVLEMNPAGRIIYANEACLRLLGYKTEEVMGQPYVKLRRPTEAPLVEKVMSQLRMGKVWQEVVSYVTTHGEEVWIQQTITPVQQLNGEIYKYILVGFDITLQKQQEMEIQNALTLARQQELLLRENTEELRRSNENYRASQLQLSAQLEALNQAAWLFETDGEGHLTYITESFAEALGYSPDKLIGTHYGALFSDRQPLVVLQGYWRSMQNGQTWKSEVEVRGALGQGYWAIMSSTPIVDRSKGERRALFKTINILFDITEQKEQEFRLKEQQNALSQLAAHPALREGDVEKAFQIIAEVALNTFQAHRVSLWRYEESDLARCVAVAEKESHSHTVGTIVNRSLYPMYFQSLEREQVIAVVDALSDLRTRELALPLFKPNNVASVLDGVIRTGKDTVGLISVEHRYTKREWRLDEVNFLRSLAASAASVIEEEQKAYARRLQEMNRRLEEQKRELEEAMSDIRESIKYAKRMQKNILPSDALLDKCLGKDNYFIIWRPRDRHGVGGDFYWFSEAAGDSYFIVVADGTGHGVPGAFMTLIGSILLDQIINKSRIFAPSQILHDLHIGVRQVLRQDVEGEEIASRDGMDIALVRYFPKEYRLIYAGANLPLYYVHDGELKEIKPDKKAIGGEQLEEERFFTAHEVQLQPGDVFFLFTDGVVDQLGGPDEKRFGTRQLKDFIMETLHEPVMSRRRAFFNMRWKEWKDYGKDREQLDDVTMWGVRLW
ncbi:MAG: PAS domain-containing protein [Bacteroidia bacterium]|nr:PAS domain-containing protein [Bacteroidia bacterium]MDW8015624.1 PAS domain-containing protein [Bacteroidia bacterium]